MLPSPCLEVMSEAEETLLAGKPCVANSTDPKRSFLTFPFLRVLPSTPAPTSTNIQLNSLITKLALWAMTTERGVFTVQDHTCGTYINYSRTSIEQI